MSDTDPPKISIDHYDIQLTVRGGSQDTMEDVQSVFVMELNKAIRRDPKFGEGGEPEAGFE